MLKISEFAKLAHTTRRTLIVYDRQDIFKPTAVSDEGYRFYAYSQLYDISFILTLRRLGLSIADIQKVRATTDKRVLDVQLGHLQDSVQGQINDLLQIHATLSERLNAPDTNRIDVKLTSPCLQAQPQTWFWQSVKVTECTDQEIAETYASFYHQLDPLVVTNGKTSGFFVDLPGCQSALYPTAPFVIVKETTHTDESQTLTQMVMPAGQYAMIDVENTPSAICEGMDQLKTFIDDHHLAIAANMWQINRDEDMLVHGASANVRLAYLTH